MNSGLVSCIIPSYKRNDTLKRAIISVLNQTYDHIEVIVVDDNTPNDIYSTQVQQIIESLNSDKIRYIQQTKHINGAVARNVGIKASKGEYVAFLDDDDEWLPQKIEKQITALIKNKEYGGATCLYTIYKNNVIKRICKPYTSDNLHRKIIERSVAVCTPTLLFRKDILMHSGLFDESLIRHQDLQLLLDFTITNKLYVLNEYLVNIYNDSNINRPSTEQLLAVKKDFFQKIEKHLQLYSNQEQREILSAHFFEIINSAIKEKKLKTAFNYIGKIGINLKAYIALIQRIIQRI